MRIIIEVLAILVVAIFTELEVKAQYPTDSASVYLLTASPGDEIYAGFGHSAIRVADPSRNKDIVYNYGSFDFSTPNFYLKFTTGKLMYSIGKKGFYQFLNEYQSWGQAIYQQQFNLTNKEKWQLIKNLETNYLPENRLYRYSFFFDNCATRIRDIVAKSIEGTITYKLPVKEDLRTYRQLMAPYMKSTPWSLFGMNLILGIPADRTAQITDYMYLPGHMKEIYSVSEIRRGNSISKCVSNEVEFFPSTLVFTTPSPFSSPFAIFSYLFLLIAVVTLFEFKEKKHQRWITFIFFFFVGLLSLLILFLQFASLHHELHQNMNVAWANPLALILAIALLIKPKARWVKITAIIYLAMLLLYFPIALIAGQSIEGAFYPIIGIMVLRALATLGR